MRTFFFHCFLRGEEGRERNMDLLPPLRLWTRDCTRQDQGINCKLYMCPDRESKPQPSDLGDHAPTNWATLARADHLNFGCWRFKYVSSLWMPNSHTYGLMQPTDHISSEKKVNQEATNIYQYLVSSICMFNKIFCKNHLPTKRLKGS